jgi:glucose-fructose oxidoreductase
MKKSKRVRWAVIGLGHFAQKAILPGFESAKNAELVALVSDDQEKLRKLGKKYDVEHRGSYDELEAVLREADVDAVYLALPNTLHRPFVERCARAGVDILCEKPMAVTVEDCEAMIRTCQDNQVRLMIAYRLHFEEANLRAIELARSGKLGELRSFNSTFSFQVTPGNIRTREETGGGPLHDIGVYCVNAARYLFGDEPIEVSAVAASREDERFQEIDEQVSVIMRFPRERLATFTVSFGSADAGWYELTGTDGRLCVDPAYEYVGGRELYLQRGDKEKVKRFKGGDQIAAEISYFSDCVRDGVEPEPSGTEGLADIRVIEAIQRSLDTGAPVTLGGFEKRRRPGPEQIIKKPAHGNPQTVHVQPPTQ